MRIAIAAVLVTALVVPCAVCNAESIVLSESQMVQNQFKQVITARHTRIKANVPRGEQITENDLVRENGVTKLRDTADLLAMLPSQGRRKEIIAQLKSVNPSYRGLACELLRCVLDVSALPALGALLDDDQKCIYGQLSVAQVGPEFAQLLTLTVGDAARKALAGMTGIEFQKRADFESWWKTNSDYEDKLWYWASRWWHESKPEKSDSQSIHSVVALVPKPDIVAHDIAGLLSSLEPDAGLRILLLVRNEWALADEIALSLGPKETWLRGQGHFWYAVTSGPTKEQLIAYVKGHKLQGRLIELLRQKDLYPEVASDAALAALARQISEMSADVLTAGDEAAIIAAENVDKPLQAPVSELVLLRTQLVPDRAQSIMRDALTKHPSLSEVTRAFVKNLGAGDADALVTSFATISAFDQRGVAEQVMMSAGKTPGIDQSLIRRLVDVVADPGGYGHDTAGVTLGSLARAANTLSDTALISEDDIKAARRITYKGTLTDAEKAHNAYLPQAVQSLKERLLVVLP